MESSHLKTYLKVLKISIYTRIQIIKKEESSSKIACKINGNEHTGEKQKMHCEDSHRWKPAGKG